MTDTLQMRLSATTEWIVIGVLILYIAFTPGIPVVREFLSTQVGKAVGLGVVVYVWKYVSEPVALLLTVNFVRCAGMREYLVNMPSTTSEKHCPSGYKLKEGTCKKEGSPDKPATVCSETKPKWDAEAGKCVDADATTVVGGAGGNGAGTGTGMSSGTEGFQPSEKKETFANGLEFAPV